MSKNSPYKKRIEEDSRDGQLEMVNEEGSPDGNGFMWCMRGSITVIYLDTAKHEIFRL
jgi:hypothetical protein